jgi:Ca2+:H+ antiporter
MWAVLIPIASIALLVVGLFLPLGVTLPWACVAALIGAVICTVHHAEVVALRVGERFGALVLALAMTVMEVALILTIMSPGGPERATLPRDVIFASIMIVCNGVVGVCLLIAGLRHREQPIRIVETHTALATLIALIALSLVLPTFTARLGNPTDTVEQRLFAASTSLVLWTMFVIAHTLHQRDYFLSSSGAEGEGLRVRLPPTRIAWTSFGLLLVALVAAVGMARVLLPSIDAALSRAPKGTIGIAIALLVLMPEIWATVRAALANRLQTSLDLAFSAALASIGLTIPAIALASILLGLPLALGLGPKDLVLLVLTFIVTSITLLSRRIQPLHGAVHLVIFVAFLLSTLVK